MATKKAVKKSDVPVRRKTAKRTKRGHPEAISTEPVEVTVKVDANNMAHLTELKDRIASSAAEVVHAADLIANHRDAGEKQLHRRVLLFVYDSVGTRISNSSFDLGADDSLYVNVGKDGATATTAQSGR